MIEREVANVFCTTNLYWYAGLWSWFGENLGPDSGSSRPIPELCPANVWEPSHFVAAKSHNVGEKPACLSGSSGARANSD